VIFLTFKGKITHVPPVLLDLKTYFQREIRTAKACNWREDGKWYIWINLDKIHGNSSLRKIVEDINDLYIQELLCVIIRGNTVGEIPPCESDEFTAKVYCSCYQPRMFLKISEKL